MLLFAYAESWKDFVGLPTVQSNPFFLSKGYLKVGQLVNHFREIDGKHHTALGGG